MNEKEVFRLVAAAYRLIKESPSFRDSLLVYPEEDYGTFLRGIPREGGREQAGWLLDVPSWRGLDSLQSALRIDLGGERASGIANSLYNHLYAGRRDLLEGQTYESALYKALLCKGVQERKNLEDML